MLTSLSPVDCSCDDWAISDTSPSMSAIRLTIPPRALPVSPTSLTPRSTWAVLLAIRALISRAASAERWARARTSWATTAKPRPASPARRLHARVQGQKIGLEGDFVDHPDDVGDLFGAFLDLAHGGDRLLHLPDRILDVQRGARCLICQPADLARHHQEPSARFASLL